MCKIAVIPKIEPGLEKKALKFAKALTPFLTKSDHDGFGYMALGTSGIFTERWLDVRQAWRTQDAEPKTIRDVLTDYNGVLEKESGYISTGTRTERFSCLAIHARMATCDVSLTNTHPFLSDDGNTALIHNGVIHNAREFLRRTTCDSEAILNLYTDHAIMNRLDNINKVTESLSGYYACAVISKDQSGNWILDVFKDDRAELSAVYVPNLKTVVFCTKPGFVRSACRRLGWKCGPVFEFRDKTLVRHDALTGKVMQSATFETGSSYLQAVPERFAPEERIGDTVENDLYEIEESDLNDDDGPIALDQYMKNPFYYKS